METFPHLRRQFLHGELLAIVMESFPLSAAVNPSITFNCALTDSDGVWRLNVVKPALIMFSAMATNVSLSIGSPSERTSASPRLEGACLQVLTGFRQSIYQSRADSDDGKALRLELHGPLDRRDMLCRLGHSVGGYIIDADATDEFGVHASDPDEDNALHTPRTQKGEEGRHTVDKAEGVDFKLANSGVRGQ